MQLKPNYILERIYFSYFMFEGNQREKVLDYMLSLEVFSKEYEMSEVIMDLVNICSEKKLNLEFNTEDLKDDNEPYWDKLKIISPEMLNYFNNILFNRIISGVRENLSENIQFKVEIPFEEWSIFYSGSEAEKIICYRKFTKQLTKWLEITGLLDSYVSYIDNDNTTVAIYFIIKNTTLELSKNYFDFLEKLVNLL